MFGIKITKEKLLMNGVGLAVGSLVILYLAGAMGILTGEFEPTYYTGILSDVEIENGRIGAYSKTTLFFEDGKVITISGIFDDLNIGQNYTATHILGQWVNLKD